MTNSLTKKVDFIALISVKMANPNGDPLNGNRPRTDYEGFGEISDVCIKRKLRNRMQDLGHSIFVKSNDRADDGCKCLKERADALLNSEENKGLSRQEVEEKLCQAWLDVRAFGQLFAFGGKSNNDGVSIGIRGPVSIHQAVSLSPVEIRSLQITKSVSNEAVDKRGSDTMGMKHLVPFGLYVLKGSINPQLAKKTGFSDEDAEVLKECLKTLFENDASSARPDGSMEVVRLYWWEHNCPSGQYSTAKVHRSVKVALKGDRTVAKDVDDYEITLEKLEGLTPEVWELS